MAELKRGVLLKGRYRIDGVIGQGAMGSVYQARDEALPGAVWALKILCESDLQPGEVSEAVTLFRREADICARLRHPGLPEIIDFFSESGCHCLVMERIHGETLEDIVERRRRPLDEAELLPLLIQLASCLEYLHEQKPHPIIFRDLKPSNCMVTGEGKLKLIDFGIARYHKPGRKSDTIVIGTPGFCAPEQYGSGQTEPRSDIYSLGAMAWHLLSGQDPSGLAFNFPPLQQVAPACSARIEAILERCVAFDPESRYPNAAELGSDLCWAHSQLALARSWRPAAPWKTKSWRSAPRYTNKLQRTGNQPLTGSTTTVPAASTVFRSVRPSSGASLSDHAIDLPFLWRWSRRTFRVWWGPGSIYVSRVLGLLFLVMVLSAVAHLWLEEGDKATARPRYSDRGHLGSCVSRLEVIKWQLQAYRADHKGYPPPEKIDSVLTVDKCPTMARAYRYDVSMDLKNYTMVCIGGHDRRAGFPRLDSRSGRIICAEDVR